jgi:hypothetical protein
MEAFLRKRQYTLTMSDADAIVLVRALSEARLIFEEQEQLLSGPLGDEYAQKVALMTDLMAQVESMRTPNARAAKLRSGVNAVSEQLAKTIGLY